MTGKISLKLRFTQHPWSSQHAMCSQGIGVIAILVTTEGVAAEKPTLHVVLIVTKAKFVVTSIPCMRTNRKIAHWTGSKSPNKKLKRMMTALVVQTEA